MGLKWYNLQDDVCAQIKHLYCPPTILSDRSNLVVYNRWEVYTRPTFYDYCRRQGILFLKSQKKRYQRKSKILYLIFLNFLPKLLLRQIWLKRSKLNTQVREVDSQVREVEMISRNRGMMMTVKIENFENMHAKKNFRWLNSRENFKALI